MRLYWNGTKKIRNKRRTQSLESDHWARTGKMLQFLEDDSGTTKRKRQATPRPGKTPDQATWVYLKCASRLRKVKYSCGQCNHQVTRKEHLVWHRRAVHERIKYLCGQYDHRANSKGSLAQHNRAKHENGKYPCGQSQCDYQAIPKWSLDQHKRELHEG